MPRAVAERATKRAQIIRGGIDGAVGCRSEGVEEDPDIRQVAYPTTCPELLIALGYAERATKRAQIIRGGIDGAVGRRSKGVEVAHSDQCQHPLPPVRNC